MVPKLSIFSVIACSTWTICWHARLHQNCRSRESQLVSPRSSSFAQNVRATNSDQFRQTNQNKRSFAPLKASVGCHESTYRWLFKNSRLAAMTGHEAGRYRARGGGTAVFEVLWKGLVWAKSSRVWIRTSNLQSKNSRVQCFVLFCLGLTIRKKEKRKMDGWILWRDGCFIDRLINS